MKLSIIIPVYNEIKTLEKIINKIINLKEIDKQVIVVDDGSTDGSRQLIKSKIVSKVSKVIYHKNNKICKKCINNDTFGGKNIENIIDIIYKINSWYIIKLFFIIYTIIEIITLKNQ